VVLDNLKHRFDVLVNQGEELARKLPRDSNGTMCPWISKERIPEYYAWLSSAVNLVLTVAPTNSFFNEECDRIMTNPLMAQGGVHSEMFLKAQGLLVSAKDEWNNGLMRRIEYVIAAENFDDFLNHAAQYHKGNKKIEASVLASAVLEDTV
jgi:hypothetical protein